MGEGACLSLALLEPWVSNRLLSMLRVARWGASQCRHTCMGGMLVNHTRTHTLLSLSPNYMIITQYKPTLVVINIYL